MKKMLLTVLSMAILVTTSLTPIVQAQVDSKSGNNVTVSRSIASIDMGEVGVFMAQVGIGIVWLGMYVLAAPIYLLATPYLVLSRAQCSPEDLQNNLETTDNVLLGLANSDEFAGQEQFKQIVNEIATIESQEEKVNRYFALLDIKTSEDVMHFVGARDSEIGQYVDTLEKNTGLSNELAIRAVGHIVDSLQGNLR